MTENLDKRPVAATIQTRIVYLAALTIILASTASTSYARPWFSLDNTDTVIPANEMIRVVAETETGGTTDTAEQKKPAAKTDMKGMDMRGSHGMDMDMNGMVMGANKDTLPRSCSAISKDVSITVHAGRKYAKQGGAFGYDINTWNVPKCSRVTVTFVNDDQVRHQWMLHGLPRYQYSMGMFHIEANGGTKRSGTFIVPNTDETYLIHCDMSQHMEKGLKGIFKVGAGNRDLPSVPGRTGARVTVDETGSQTIVETLVIIFSSFLGLTAIWWVARRTRGRVT